MRETLELKIGEEKPVRLPPLAGGWEHQVSGMTSAVHVQKMWTSAPYPEDDDDGRPSGPSYMVFMIRGLAPGSATVRFTPGSGSADPHEVEVSVHK